MFYPSRFSSSSYVKAIIFSSIQSRKKSLFRSFACPFHTRRGFNLHPAMSDLETIIQRWIRDEGLSREDAREMAIAEIDFYNEEPPPWKGPNDSTQEYI